MENNDMTVQEFYSGFDLSFMTEEERQTIYTATELYAKGKLRQSGKERDALEKYGQHLPTCNINQDWSEAYDAMANTPNELRGEDYWEALLEMDEKRKKCTCGFEQALSTDVGEQDERKTICCHCGDEIEHPLCRNCEIALTLPDNEY